MKHTFVKYFSKKIFNSTDKFDNIQTLNKNWELDQHNRHQNAGGNYLSLHWRRADFLQAHQKHLPSIEGTANQVFIFF